MCGLRVRVALVIATTTCMYADGTIQAIFWGQTPLIPSKWHSQVVWALGGASGGLGAIASRSQLILFRTQSAFRPVKALKRPKTRIFLKNDPIDEKNWKYLCYNCILINKHLYGKYFKSQFQNIKSLTRCSPKPSKSKLSLYEISPNSQNVKLIKLSCYFIIRNFYIGLIFQLKIFKIKND